MKISKTKATVIVILLTVAFVFLGRWVTGYPSQYTKTTGVSARSKGNPQAPIKIIEFIDFQCPACAKGALLLKDYTRRYPSQIFLEMKHYPLSKTHRFSFLSSLYAECAGHQGKFWEFTDLLVTNQSQWIRMMDAARMFNRFAEDLQLNAGKLKACLENEKTRSTILKDKEEGSALGVHSTPTYFLNGKMVVGMKSLQEALDKNLQNQGGP